MDNLKHLREEFEGNEKEATKISEAKKKNEAEGGIDGVIQALVDAKPSDDNADQGKFVSLMKGLAFSDDPKATAFMKKLMGAIDSSFAGGKNEEKLKEENIMKACCDLDSKSTDEEIEAVAKKGDFKVESVKKIAMGKKDMEEGLSGAEVESMMKKAHTAEILDMMSDEEKDKAISKKLSGYSEEIAKMAK